MKNTTLLKNAFADGKAQRTPWFITYCTSETCAHRDDCLHALAYAAKDESLHVGECVFPDARQTDGTCPFHAPLRVVRMAWGFGSLFTDVKAKDAPALRREMRDYLGSNAQYYRYKLGQLRLLPEQQEHIKALFARYGYDGVDFEHFSLEVDLTQICASGSRFLRQ